MACCLDGTKPLSKLMLECCHWTLRNKLQWNFNLNSNIFIQENALQNVVWEMASIFLFRPQCVDICITQPQWVKLFKPLHELPIVTQCIFMHYHVFVLRSGSNKWDGIQALRWRHNGRDSISNHQPHDCLLNLLFRCRSKKTSKLCVSGLCVGNSPGTGEFPAQMASNVENVSIWWCHHEFTITQTLNSQ